MQVRIQVNELLRLLINIHILKQLVNFTNVSFTLLKYAVPKHVAVDPELKRYVNHTLDVFT